MKNLIAFLLLLLPIMGNCQKTIETPENTSIFNNLQLSLGKYNLDDLSSSKDSLRIRVWMGNNIVELKVNDITSTNLILSIPSNKEPKSIVKSYSFDSSTAQILCDSLIHKGIMNLAGDSYRGIDGQFYLFEVSTPEKYRLSSYWSSDKNRSQDNREIIKMLTDIHNILDIKTHQKEFYNSLESGTYRIGMSTIRKDQFLDKDIPKSSLYTFVEKRMREELGIDNKTCCLKYPLFIMDNQICFFKDINNKEYSQTKKITLLAGSEPSTIALYGSSASYGIVIIETE